MIISRAKNQSAVQNIIIDYCNNSIPELHRHIELKRFIKYFAEHIIPRIQEDDCYFIDFLDDVQRLGEE